MRLMTWIFVVCCGAWSAQSASLALAQTTPPTSSNSGAATARLTDKPLDEESIWKQMSGEWRPVEMLVNGQKMPPEVQANTRLKVSRGKYLVTFGPTSDEGTVTLKLDPASPTMGMDLQGTAGPNADKLIQTIFKFEGSNTAGSNTAGSDAARLIVCYNINGGDRPQAFESNRENPFALITYERVTEPGSPAKK